MGLLSGVNNLETTPCSGGCASLTPCLPSPVLVLSLVALQDVPVVPCWCWEGEEEQLFLGLSVEVHRHSGVVLPPLLQQCPVCTCCSSGAVLSQFSCLSQKGDLTAFTLK